MKKILLATTMLASVAGYAAADVSVSGDARMGLVNAYIKDNAKNGTVFSSRVRIKFSGSGTTDGGISFGGSFRAADSQGANEGVKGSTFISGAFGKISMGDVDSGDKASVGQLASVGYTGLGSTNEINYAADGFDLFGMPAAVSKSAPKTSTLTSSTGTFDSLATTVHPGAAAKVLYSYSAGSLTVNASAGQISNGVSDKDSFGVGATYTVGSLTVAAGYGSNEFDFTSTVLRTPYANNGGVLTISDNPAKLTYAVEGSVTDATLGATYVMGATTLKAIYQDKEVSGTIDSEDVSATATSMGLSVSHKIDVLTLTAFAVTTDLTSNVTSLAQDESISFSRTGIGAAYDLGGGATITAGVVNVEAPSMTAGISSGYPTAVLGTSSHTAYDLGVNFSF